MVFYKLLLVLCFLFVRAKTLLHRGYIIFCIIWKESPVGSGNFPWLFSFAACFFFLPTAYFILPLEFLFYRDLFLFAVRFFLLQRDFFLLQRMFLFCRAGVFPLLGAFFFFGDQLFFCREHFFFFFFAAEIFLLPWHLWATVILRFMDVQSLLFYQRKLNLRHD